MLETNGKFSRSRKNKHIKAKFFFINDKVDNQEVKNVDCPAGVIWADVTTKPLQGTELKKMRTQLMNCAMEYIVEEEYQTKKKKTLIDQASKQDAIQTVQECVGRYPTIKLGTRKFVSKRTIQGIDGIWTGMRTL